MQPTIVFDSLSAFNDNSTHTTSTLTPTTLKLLFDDSYECVDSFQHQFSDAGFVPPLPPTSQIEPNSKSLAKRSYFNLTGGTTTIVAQKSKPPPATIPIEKVVDSDYSEQTDEEEEEDYQPRPKMLKKFNSKADKKENVSGNKRKGNRKDDYDGLPPAQRQLLAQKRERNKQAAARCRQRKMDLTNTLLEEVNMWKGKKSELEEEIRLLQSQKEELEFVLQAHNAVCQLGHVHAPLQNNRVIVVPVKNEEPEPDQYADILGESTTFLSTKRPRPLTLSFASERHTGIGIETPSNGIPCFENFLTPSTGMTPMPLGETAPVVVETLNTPIVHSVSLNTPGETVNLIAL